MRPLIQIGNETREMTADEHAHHLADMAAQNDALEANNALRESGRKKLAAIGLTNDEINALLGF